jgi:hypothetical protein
MLTKRQAGTSRAGVRRAFGLAPGEARALWEAPDGEWVLVVRGQGCPFVLRNLDEWHELAPEEEVELMADAGGRVRRRGEPVAPGDPAWVVPEEVRAGAGPRA